MLVSSFSCNDLSIFFKLEEIKIRILSRNGGKYQCSNPSKITPYTLGKYTSKYRSSLFSSRLDFFLTIFFRVYKFDSFHYFICCAKIKRKFLSFSVNNLRIMAFQVLKSKISTDQLRTAARFNKSFRSFSTSKMVSFSLHIA
jgi:hypothetical protein